MAPPFIPDVPYKIQGLFILTFAYIWSTAFKDDYLEPLPLDDEAKRTEILVSVKNVGILLIITNLNREPTL